VTITYAVSKLARVRAKVADLVEELSEAGLNLTAGRVESTLVILDGAKQTLMSAIRDAAKPQDGNDERRTECPSAKPLTRAVLHEPALSAAVETRNG
jgi:hypothetical protein